MTRPLPRNAELAGQLDLLADLSELLGEQGFRVVAYRRAATRIRDTAASVAEMALAGTAKDLPGIGKTIEEKLVEVVENGEMAAVAKRRAEVPEELVQQELDALRATIAELVPVEGRTVGPDDTVVIDLISPNGETRRDYVVELGRGAVVDEVEQGVVGMSTDETKEITFELADESEQAVSVTV